MEAFHFEELEFRPVTLKQWPDLQELFGPNGADSGCWCMWWRQTRAEFARRHGEPNRRSMEGLLRRGEVPGILAYHEHRPVGWCSVAPRERFPSLDRSPNLKPVDGEKVWSIVCFFIPRQNRRRGLCGHLIRAAVQYARSRGAAIVEAYPVDPRRSASRPAAAFTGLLDAFLAAGFREVARRSPQRPILRLILRLSPP
jgi:GNAT superfamily N-acetyltransferase